MIRRSKGHTVELVIVLAAVALFVLVFRDLMLRKPLAFYVAAAVLDLLHITGVMWDLAPEAWILFFPWIQRAWLSFALFTVVMLVGVLPQDSALRRSLVPIRGTLSIVAAILTVPHVFVYLREYLSRLLSGFTGISNAMQVSFFVSFVLVVLLVILTVTSLKSMIRRMRREAWKKVQSAAYVFFVLIYVHVAFMLVPTASSGGNALDRIVLYMALLVVYVAARVYRAVRDGGLGDDRSHGSRSDVSSSTREV